MKAPYNMKVNGRWYMTGEWIPEQVQEAEQAVMEEVAEVAEVTEEAAPKPARKRSRKAAE